MIRSLLAMIVALIGVQANADLSFFSAQDLQKTFFVRPMAGLDWKVGDVANYSIDMGFLQGTMVMKVRQIASDGIWLDQDMDMGFAGKQKVEMLIDQNTGELKKLIVNGKEEALPENSESEIIEAKEDKITVKAGTFECVYAKIGDKKTNETVEIWINPQIVPMMGLIKQVAQSQFGPVTLELTSFTKM